MNPTPLTDSTARKPIRLWPGVVVLGLQWLLRFVVPVALPDLTMYAIMGSLAGGLLILVWWLGFSRVPWLERLGGVVVIAAALIGTRRVVHPSIVNGMMGMMLTISAIPFLSLALVAWAALSGALTPGVRRLALVGAIALACGLMTLVRTGGMSGDGVSDFHWRWTPTPEDRLLAQSKPSPQPAAAPAATPAVELAVTAWPGFRGPQRDGVVRGVQIATDWSRSAPVELWRRPVGPGWSSFAVDGHLVYTQEQRGEEELVSCYDLSTGAPVWTHADPARFWESNAGAGPRGTPTLSHGRVYSFGGTGLLNALDARTGAVVWSRNAAADTKKKVPDWGFASSPLVVDDTVVIATAGVLAAYHTADGAPRWIGARGAWGYSSPHLSTLDGVQQVVLFDSAGATGVALADGQPLWSLARRGDGIVQPAVLTGGDILIGSGSGLGGKVGVCRVTVAHNASGWTAEERWTSIALKPYFNDFVVHKNHAYGFDGNGLACIDLADGARQWKGGRYGHGQLVLLADQDLLLVLSEEGDLALVQGVADQFTELARIPAIKGKTWNHPVLAGHVVLVRNAEEMAAFRLALKSG